MAMRKLIFISALLITLSSCNTYYYSILDTPNTDTECIENGDFLFENDSLWVAYNFGGRNAPVKITIFNKLNTPLSVDWKRSALIINNVAESYASSDSPFFGNSISESIQTHNDRSVTYKEFGGVIEGSKDIGYIFPQTMISNQFMNIYADYKNIRSSDYDDIEIPNRSGKKYTVKKANYNIHNTPLKFKSYLTLFYDAEKPIQIQTEFYVAGLIKSSGLTPSTLPHNMDDKGNIFYYEKTNNAGWYIFGGVAGVGAMVLILTADMSTDIDHPNF